jgi:hypothetical protein
MLEAQVVNKATDQRPFPDVILKSQFFDTIGKRSLTSEQRLMLAVLADAINLVQEGHRSVSPRKRNSFSEAKNWIFQSGVRCPLSFENVCDALAIDADALRWRVAALISGNPEAMPAPLRLRLKEASRVQRLTVNRVRRREPRRNRLRAAAAQTSA